MSKNRKKNNDTLAPPFLKKGDKVAIVAPGSPVTEDALKPALSYLEEWGLATMVYPQVYTKNCFFAGNDAERLNAFQSALDDPSVKAILCARGGYGSVRILPYLDFSRFLKKPKWIIGFSDITVFHSYLTHTLGIQSIHAPMAIHFRDYNFLKESFDKLRCFLFDGHLEYTFPPHPLNKPGEAEAILTGGNLSVLYSLRGTPADINPSGNILFIEDVDEFLYHTDRMLANLKYGGLLKGLKGLIAGSFSEMKDKTTPFGKTAEEIIADTVNEYDFPVAFGFSAGHVKENYPLVMNRKVLLKVTRDGIILNF